LQQGTHHRYILVYRASETFWLLSPFDPEESPFAFALFLEINRLQYNWLIVCVLARALFANAALRVYTPMKRKLLPLGHLFATGDNAAIDRHRPFAKPGLFAKSKSTAARANFALARSSVARFSRKTLFSR
jgi:hypothetical protein